jgi:hypothetical protein
MFLIILKLFIFGKTYISRELGGISKNHKFSIPSTINNPNDDLDFFEILEFF